MNSGGRSLLIGVADDGEILGIEPDYQILRRKDSDGFEQAIITIVSTNLGADLCQYLHLAFHRIKDKEVCRIIIKASPRPVYLVDKGRPQFFFKNGWRHTPLEYTRSDRV